MTSVTICLPRLVFEAIDIKPEQHGSYTTLEQAQATWEAVMVHPTVTSPKVMDNGLSHLCATQLAQIKAKFEAELAALQTEEGIWDDRTTLYILGHRPR